MVTINQLIVFYAVPILSSFGLSLIVTWWVRRMAWTWNILDEPVGGRKIHTTPTPLLGGLALCITVVSLVLVFLQSGWLAVEPLSGHVMVGLLVASLIVLIGGVIDDAYSLHPLAQLVWPVLAICVVVFAGIRVDYITDPRGGIVLLENWHIVVPSVVAALWLLGMMYTTKILDGLDGLASGIGLIGSVIIFVVSLSWNEPFSSVSVLALVVAGSLFGFLVFNFHPASIFLGESGSVLTGFWLGVLAIVSGSKIATALLIMGIPILDLGWVIVRRLCIDKKSIASADQKHLHHRLLALGWGQRRTVLFLYFLTLLFGSVALWQETIGKLIALTVLVVVMIGIGFLIVRNSHNHEKK